MKTVICSGYFNPLHVGHIEYLEAARQLGNRLWVIVNSDRQVALKEAQPFMGEDDRLRIVSSLRVVDKAVLSIDEDLTVRETLRVCNKEAQKGPGYYVKVVFVNGGDRTADEIPEVGVCSELGIEMVFGVGGEKVASSSELLAGVTDG